MTVTIYEGYDSSYMLLGATDERFQSYSRKFGNVVQSIKDLRKVSAWVNNELGEECLFEVD